MSVGNYALARCIKEAAAFFEVAGEVRDKGMVKVPYGQDRYLTSVREEFKPSAQWKDALWTLYAALSSEVEEAILSPDHDGFDSQEISAWLKANRGDLFEEWGWVYRIINLINYARRANEAPADLGDSEFDLMKRVIEQKVTEKRALKTPRHT